MKILIIHCSFIYTGGGERIVLEQIDNLTKRANTVDCYTPIIDKKKCFPDIINTYNIKTFLPQLPHWVPLRHAFTMLATCILAPFFAFKYRGYDVIIGENQPGAWLAYIIAKTTRTPYIVYLNHPNRILYPREHEDWAAVKDFKILSVLLRLFRPLIKIFDKMSINAARQRLVNGIFIGNEIEKIYQSSWIPCPSGAVRAKKTQGDENITINGRTIDKKYILYTGRHQPWKRIDWLIEIANRVYSQYRDFYLIIPGAKTPHTTQLITQVRKAHAQDHVLFIGDITQTHLHQLYNNATVYAFPSEKEDFGIVVIEAMAHGVPVVAWNIGGPTDSILNEKTGFLIEPYNKEKFAQSLLNIITSNTLREKLSSNARDHISKNFSWTKHTNILEAEIKKIAKTTTKNRI